MKYTKTMCLWIVFIIISLLLSLFWGLGDISDTLSQTILYQVRIPRTLQALLAGVGLTLAGHMFQTLLNNPLADSFTLGLASGATFGSGLAVVIGVSFIWLPIFSVLFSIMTLILVIVLTSVMSRGYPVRTLILAGIMIGALFNAFLYVLIIFNQEKMNNIVNYMFGGFSSAEYNEVIYIGIVLSIGMIILLSLVSKIKILQLGDLRAQSLGLNVRSVTYSVLLIASIITAVIVAYVGVIGFIGMVIPQLVRRSRAHYNLRQQMLLNIVIGGTIMVLSDWLGSVVLDPFQVPASIILALLGIPVLFYIMATQPRMQE
ncbi:FecCD family ABC transporter permease [Staphylococcus saprophyticus]|uniref:FecCD family ABC transporter permease n=1 Tax=Staphylococcus saprophyticus TaxID=29385 RepID=UPI000254AE75|nr:iron chelate uptake ABC transporter family permease subunit [Staphylococcus saprophyticus]EHY91771.1 putative iron compound ABC transporter permease component [Staphylococcus saprophyticus subsp. saprophyticus KACC 16562]MCC4221027.1 iron ABC transporter permease [Staphylococcus saprophyticus]MDL1994841.1 iron ABC transporter permease [Staphylococcus saprophyticus]MDT3925260.1 iron ABC transporter permease [Staphylococcus saprophyticus]MDW3851139.1 iron ABC transporter permease [Staphylococ